MTALVKKRLTISRWQWQNMHPSAGLLNKGPHAAAQAAHPQSCPPSPVAWMPSPLIRSQTLFDLQDFVWLGLSVWGTLSLEKGLGTPKGLIKDLWPKQGRAVDRAVGEVGS